MSQMDLKGYHAVARAARSILVVDLAFLGDTVHLVPALWEIKRNHPDAALHVVSAPVGAEVLRLAPCVDRAWGLGTRSCAAHDGRTMETGEGFAAEEI